MAGQIVDQIRVIGSDPDLQAETLRQAKRAVREQRATMDAEAKRLRVQRDALAAEHSGLLKALSAGETTRASISARLAELEGQSAQLDRRLAQLGVERQEADGSVIDANDLAATLSLIDPVWDVLFPAEQARIIELLIRQFEYNGKTGTLSVTFHPTGIATLAGEIQQEAAP